MASWDFEPLSPLIPSLGWYQLAVWSWSGGGALGSDPGTTYLAARLGPVTKRCRVSASSSVKWKQERHPHPRGIVWSEWVLARRVLKTTSAREAFLILAPRVLHPRKVLS